MRSCESGLRLRISRRRLGFLDRSCAAALRGLHRSKLSSPRRHETLVVSNTETDLFVYMLRKIVVRHLETHFFPQQRRVTQFYALRPLAPDCGVLLSATAYAGQENATEAYAAFAQGAEWLSHAARCEIPMLPPQQCDLSRVDVALGRLSEAVPQLRRCLTPAPNCCRRWRHREGEAELLRAIAERSIVGPQLCNHRKPARRRHIAQSARIISFKRNFDSGRALQGVLGVALSLLFEAPSRKVRMVEEVTDEW